LRTSFTSVKYVPFFAAVPLILPPPSQQICHLGFKDLEEWILHKNLVSKTPILLPVLTKSTKCRKIMTSLAHCIHFFSQETLWHSSNKGWIYRRWWFPKHEPDLRTALVIIVATSEQVHHTTFAMNYLPSCLLLAPSKNPKSSLSLSDISTTKILPQKILKKKFQFLQQNRHISRNPLSHQRSVKQQVFLFPCITMTAALFSSCAFERERETRIRMWF